MPDLLEMDGTVDRIIFQNEKNQYTVMELLTESDVFIVVGIFPFIGKGEEIKVIGYFTNHASFGTQFKAESFERKRPENTVAILRYLSGGAIKGIGAAMAKKIVDTFGKDSLEVIENEPARLAQIKGISREKADEMSAEVKRIFGIRELILYLSKFGVRPEQTIPVWKSYGGNAIDMIKENPYCICADGVDIDFTVADTIAQSMERLPDESFRVCAGVVYVLKYNSNNGHTCIPSDKLCKASTKLLNVNIEKISTAVQTLCETGELICSVSDGVENIFLPKNFGSEMYIAQRVNMMLKYPPRCITRVDEQIAEVEISNGVKYADLQKEAISAALDKGLLILTGGPGTGKTTTLNAIIEILQKNGEEVFLAAPTGRAAKRMSELTGKEAKTIHRMLQVDWDEFDRPIFIRNEKKPLECDAVVVDELSMVDVNVMEALIAALPLGCRVILVGDTDQLPSVGAGNVLKDLILSKKIKTVELKEVFRQARESLIVMNSHAIVKGEFPIINRVDSDFFYMPANDETKIINTVSDLISTRLPKKYGYSPNEDIQILCPGRKGLVGTETLNASIRDRINPESTKKKQAQIMGTTFREGDKVMHMKNNYNLPWTKDDGNVGEGVFNGDMGIIEEIDKAGGVVRVRIDDKIATYEFEQVGQELEHAYAVTVHKSQGNEFSAVIIPLFKGTDKLKYRNLLYTAITRAKEILIIIGQRQVIEDMIRNDKKTLRYTGLLSMLKEHE